jgi:hypothetical protein
MSNVQAIAFRLIVTPPETVLVLSSAIVATFSSCASPSGVTPHITAVEASSMSATMASPCEAIEA